ncbi:MAG TPA: response regulator [Phycisphaerae bacterium]|nr:response regulator [Phycisphaerae bacterium]
MEGDWVRGITGYFEPRHVGVCRAYTGREAIGFVEEGGIDAAILSTDLPRMDGLSVLRIIRSIDNAIPCVVVTADASKRILQRALELQAYTVLTKPVDLAALRRVMVGLFRKRLRWELD